MENEQNTEKEKKKQGTKEKYKTANITQASRKVSPMENENDKNKEIRKNKRNIKTILGTRKTKGKK